MQRPEEFTLSPPYDAPCARIAVLRPLGLGDLLLAVPALRALDAAFPQASIVLVALPWARTFVARFRRYVDAFVEFPGFPGMRDRAPDLARLPLFFDAMRAGGFDLVIQMHGAGELANPLAVLMGAKHTAGYLRPGRFNPDPSRYLAWRDHEPEGRRWLRLLEHLGVPSQGEALEFPLEARDYREVGALDFGRYALLHPGSREGAPRWTAPRFAQVADRFAREGLRVVLTGTAAEGAFAREIRRAMREPAADLTGRTSLGGLGVLVQGATLVVSGSAAVSHIAAAMRVPLRSFEACAA